ncbi:MAG: 50S ribosomal protein L25/general stress protein Ctc [Gammaproteobacteria bacterium]|jgi:large subunit ribosomal protein L25|nr:50S ribosomal protein L25/general stress protein Ctc [Gammaproteobacteria bacterium]
MAISFELNAEPRTDTGKGASRRLRHAGKVPAIMYGGGKDPESLMLSHNEVLRNLAHEAFYSHILTIKSGGTETSAILRDLQRHPSRPVIMHMDLQRINAAEKLKTQSPVHVVGEDTSAAVKAGGLVSHDLTEVAIECLPKDLPEYLEIDISEMEVGDVKHLSDMKVPEGVTLSDLVRENDLAVVSIHAKRAEVEEDIAPVDEGAVEGGEESKADGEGEDS